MADQPEALRLADGMTRALQQTDAEDDVIHVSRWFVEDSRDELRRLHAVNAELLEALRVFVSCATPVSTEIDERGYRWTEAYLDQALPIARVAIARAEGELNERP